MSMKKGIVALLACMFALSLALVGCSGGGDVKAAWVGTWDPIEWTEEGQLRNSDDLQMLKDLGLTFSLELNDDGTAKLMIVGEAVNGEWEAKSATEGTFKLEDGSADMKIADGKLTMQLANDTIVFEKTDAASSGAASAAASSASSSGA